MPRVQRTPPCVAAQRLSSVCDTPEKRPLCCVQPWISATPLSEERIRVGAFAGRSVPRVSSARLNVRSYCNANALMRLYVSAASLKAHLPFLRACLTRWQRITSAQRECLAGSAIPAAQKSLGCNLSNCPSTAGNVHCDFCSRDIIALTSAPSSNPICRDVGAGRAPLVTYCIW